MKTAILARLVAAGAMVAAAAGAAPAQALKPWKHGIIAPKADAGFLLMAAKRGFAEREGLKLELLEVKDDQIGLKALLAGAAPAAAATIAPAATSRARMAVFISWPRCSLSARQRAFIEIPVKDHAAAIMLLRRPPMIAHDDCERPLTPLASANQTREPP